LLDSLLQERYESNEKLLKSLTFESIILPKPEHKIVTK